MADSTVAPDLLSVATFLQSDLDAIIVYPTNENYDNIKPQFEESGHAFLLHDQKLVVIDGEVVSEEWFTLDHLYVILAHELAHYRADHAAMGPIMCDVEKEADWLGCMILRSQGKESSSKLHAEEYQARYGTNVDDDSILMHDKFKRYIF